MSEVIGGRREGEMVERFRLSGFVELALLDGLSERSFDTRTRTGRKLIGHLHDGDIHPCLRTDLGDASAHLSTTNDPDVVDAHLNPFSARSHGRFRSTRRRSPGMP